jgi:glycosyltransferase involved in cell wall biosynthesis
MTVNQESIKRTFKQKKCCVLIPTYNNAQVLTEVLDEVLAYTDDLVVVNDGSTDASREILEAYQQYHLLHLPENKGKGTALRMGFEFARELGYQYAITLDSDGQHKAKDLPVFLEKLEEEPNAIIVGARNMEQENVPGKSSFGHKFSNFWFKVETGINLPDTQSGYRLYPLEALKDIRLISWRYEFEIEVMVRAAWKGVNVVAVPIDVYYPPQEERISHFRPFQDFTRISILNTILVTWLLLYIKPRDLWRKIRSKNIREHLRDLFLNEKESPGIKALSVAFGVFMGIVPIWGYQLIVGITLSHLLRLNKAIFVLAAHISIPPMIPVLIYLSYHLGGLFIDNPSTLSWELAFDKEAIGRNLLQYVSGSMLLAAGAALFFGVLSYLILLAFGFRKQRISLTEQSK